MKHVTVKQIVTEYLKKNGYDGLHDANAPCACTIQRGLFQCANEYQFSEDCVPSHVVEKQVIECEWKPGPIAKQKKVVLQFGGEEIELRGRKK